MSLRLFQKDITTTDRDITKRQQHTGVTVETHVSGEFLLPYCYLDAHLGQDVEAGLDSPIVHLLE
jgi:hypothetical protein